MGNFCPKSHLFNHKYGKGQIANCKGERSSSGDCKQPQRYNIKKIYIFNANYFYFSELRDRTIIDLLHAILIPTGKAVSCTTKKVWKYTILNSQESFLKPISSVSDIQLELNARKALHAEFKLSTQPLIFVVESSNNYFTVYEDIVYKFDNIIHAISSAFKIHYVFNLQYQPECNLVWKLIQIHLFEIITPTNSTALSTLLTNLNV